MQLSSYVKTMYFWAIVLLSAVVAVEAYAQNKFPVGVIAAVASAVAIDVIAKKFVLKRNVGFPSSAIITGIIIGSVAPLSAPIWVYLAAAAAAIGSKFLIRIRGSHVFNPAAFGLLVGLAAFSLGDEWWAASGFNLLGFLVVPSIFLIVPNWKAMKLKLSLTFMLAAGIISLTMLSTSQFGLSGIMGLLWSLPFFYAFVMVSEPKTSPYRWKEQVVFGIALAALALGLEFYNVKYALLLALLAGNLGYALYRARIWQKQGPKLE